MGEDVTNPKAALADIDAPWARTVLQHNEGRGLFNTSRLPGRGGMTPPLHFNSPWTNPTVVMVPGVVGSRPRNQVPEIG
jgi:hypothetical protein